MYHFRMLIRLMLFLMVSAAAVNAQDFVRVKDHQFIRDGRPYYFVGTNYWYGSLLGLDRDKRRGVGRLRRELDLLRGSGITNLRLMAGAEGSGPLNGVARVGPPLQPRQGQFDEGVLDGLDLVLAEMSKRGMHAVIFFSNNWEWSGGFQQYLIWNKVISDEWLTRKPSWDELRDNVAMFYSCAPCKTAYRRQAETVLARRNKINGRRYADDPTIFAWEIANEPRPMRPAANEHYKDWIAATAASIKRAAPRQLVTIGHEGRIGTESLKLFEEVHADPNIDYLTIHIWPKNWGWFAEGKLADEYQKAESETVKYINENLAVAVKLDKPMVIEEFGLPRDGQSFDPASTTTYRDRYFATVFSFVRKYSNIAGANFWAFGGTARPKRGQPFWKAGDEFMGDPPMEEQGLNSVFSSDSSTLKLINAEAKRISAR